MYQFLTVIYYQTGPTIYRTRTVFEDAAPEVVRDFFWDDEFRPKWDPMLVHFKILEDCRDTGTMIVHWIKKVCISKCLHNCMHVLVFIIPLFSSNNVGRHRYFNVCPSYLQFPFFCSDREYIIGRRIWEAGTTYYCVTKV
jgi:hypothetical protein